jgi:DNA processing protein
LTGKTRGSNPLIKEGARLVECVEDVIEELAPQLAAVPMKAIIVDTKPVVGPKVALDENIVGPESSDVKSILHCLKGANKLHVDSIIEESRLSAQMVLKLLLDLELKGLVTQHPGKLFSLGYPTSKAS